VARPGLLRRLTFGPYRFAQPSATLDDMDLARVSDVVWEIPMSAGMRVPGRIFASEALMDLVDADQAGQQVANVAHLPGIVKASFAMPDIHWGYGFPIGGVAATAVDAGGVVSPGGVGFDICCGVRLLASAFTEEDVAVRMKSLMQRLAMAIPRGVGRGGIASPSLVPDVLVRGAAAAVEAGYGVSEDLERCEERGTTEGADPGEITERAMERGRHQLGSLGAGNHFLEIQVVDAIADPDAARAFGLAEGMVVVMLHCGSRGLGHQVCTDYLRLMGPAMQRHGISVPDRQLAGVPVASAEGRSYLAAMSAAANFAWANRHILADAARGVFADVFGCPVEATGMRLIYDVAHNLAKVETHDVGGTLTEVCVHRKGATRAFGPGHPDLPDEFRSVGQPVLVPGSMGTASWVLRGEESNPAFASAAHGAGRLMSRTAARRQSSGAGVRDDLMSAGISVSPGSVKLLSEEAPYAYKDVDEVIDVCRRAGLAAPVARLRPLAVVKG
jgi:tRNA-splicing ligase RtcB (3'-phosphate/5'-hydroxy nucleic acid ligase)